MRVLDLDLDFFVENPVISPGDGPRPSVQEHPVWPVADALAFLRDRCGLSGRLPGFVTEHHHEAFVQWRAGIDSGQLTAPFAVTHVDAHADLGMGDCGHVHLMELLALAPQGRTRPRIAGEGDWGDLQEGNFLLFAIACRWLSGLEYVHPHQWLGDLHYWYMADFNTASGHIALPHISVDQIRDMDRWMNRSFDVAEREPPIPFLVTHKDDFQVTERYDLVCLTRSPRYSPPEADALFDEIRSEFIDEDAWRR